MSLIPVANLPAVSLIPVAICPLACEYLREFSKKIQNGPNVILWGFGETDS